MKKGRTWRYRKHVKGSNTLVSGKHDICLTDVNLFKWAKLSGFNFKHFYLKPWQFTDTGRGMMSRKKVLEKSTIISVPKELLINTQSIMKDFIGDVIVRYSIRNLLPIQIICTFLMCESSKSSKSFWEPYIKSLPLSYTTPSYWSLEEVELLPAWITLKAKKQREDIKTSFDGVFTLHAILQELNPSLVGVFTYNSYLWAWNTINTRAVYMKQISHPSICQKEEDNLTLAPILDFLNHSFDVEVEAGFNINNNCYEITTRQSYNKGDQVFINYGPHDNIKLLIEYGFVLPNNPNSIVPFDLDDLLHVAVTICVSHHEQKIQIIRDQNLYRNLSCSLDGVSWNLQVTLMILSLSVKQLHLWKECLMGKYVTEEHKVLYSQNMRQLLLRKQDCIKVLEHKDDGNYHKTLIFEICNEQKSILQYCIDAVT